MTNELMSSQIENLARQGAEIISKFSHLLQDLMISSLLQESLNGKLPLINLEQLNDRLFKIIASLKKHLNSANNVDIEELHSFIFYVKHDYVNAQYAMEHIFKIKKYDNKDNEQCYKLATIYSQLVSQYEEMIAKFVKAYQK
jgi:hypothetical protein